MADCFISSSFGPFEVQDRFSNPVFEQLGLRVKLGGGSVPDRR